jgi:hypothetical protein
MAKLRAFILWSILVAVLAVPATTLAQGGYFGRNKVQYQSSTSRSCTPSTSTSTSTRRWRTAPAWRRGWPSAGTPGCPRC